MKFSTLTLAALVLLLPSTATAQGSSYRRFEDDYPNGEVPLVNDILNDGGNDPDPGGGPEGVSFGLQPSCNTIDNSGYNVCLDLTSIRGTFQPWMNAFGDAKTKWESVITGNLQPVSTAGLAAELEDIGEQNDLELICTGLPSTIDDIYICGRDADIDGPSGVLGSAAPTFGRPTAPTNPITGRPFVMTLTGFMQFDIADIAQLERRGTFLETIKHEMGHVLGLGTLWDNNELYVEGSGVYRSDTAAQAEWEAIGCSGRLPVELDGGRGTANGHWDETCLGDEIMTGFLTGQEQPFSRITIASLQDLGYEVNYNGADPFTTNDLGVCGNACPGLRRLGEDSEKASTTRNNKRKLSQEGLTAAKEYAYKMHSALKAEVDAMGELPEGIVYLADEHLIILYEEEGEMHLVPITWDEVKHMGEN